MLDDHSVATAGNAGPRSVRTGGALIASRWVVVAVSSPHRPAFTKANGESTSAAQTRRLPMSGPRDEPREPAISAGRLLTPGEVAARFGVRPKTVAEWERRGMLPAVRTAGGHRRYRERDVDELIISLRSRPPSRA
jgi:excisionase family DNA binding protein